MPDRTESSIVIDAAPGAVLDVIADFGDYPKWATEVKSATVLSEEGDGWPDRVEFVVDAGVIKDTYVLDYEWDVDEEGTGVVSWGLVKATVLKAMNGSYTLACPRRGHRRDLPARGRPHHPHARHAQAQGGEGHRRHRAPGAEEARRGLTPVRIVLFTGKGGVGKTTTAAACAVRAARSGTAHPGHVDRRGALAG